MVLHYAVVLYTRLAPYRGFFLLLSYANFYVKARKIYKFLWDGGVGFQKSPPAGSDFALRASQGQSRLLEPHTSSPKTLCVENRAKSFLEAPIASLKNFMWIRERATQGQSQLLKVPTASSKTLCARRERPAWDTGHTGGFQRIIIAFYL